MKKYFVIAAIVSLAGVSAAWIYASERNDPTCNQAVAAECPYSSSAHKAAEECPIILAAQNAGETACEAHSPVAGTAAAECCASLLKETAAACDTQPEALSNTSECGDTSPAVITASSECGGPSLTVDEKVSGCSGCSTAQSVSRED